MSDTDELRKHFNAALDGAISYASGVIADLRAEVKRLEDENAHLIATRWRPVPEEEK